MQETWFDPWIGKIPWRRKWHPTPVFFAVKSHGQRSLAVYGLARESDITEQLNREKIQYENGGRDYFQVIDFCCIC